MKTQYIVKKLWKYSSKLLLTVSCLLALTFGGHIANAATLDSHYQLLADLGSSGAKNQVEGRIKEETGKAQSAMDEAGNKVDRAVKRTSQKAEAMKGEARQNVREAKNKLEKASDRKGYYQR